MQVVRFFVIIKPVFGFVLITIASGLSEASDSIGKYAVSKKIENIYTLGFLSLFWTEVFILVSVILGMPFVFNINSLPTFSLRIIFEILQTQLTLYAIIKADRSTFSFVRLITIPLLVLVDFRLHYFISVNQLIGIALIFFTIAILFKTGKREKKGSVLAFLTGINAVITISLYKYDISNYNSVAAEQFIVILFIMVYLILRNKDKPWKYLLKPLPGSQSLLGGLGSAIEGFAYAYAPASVILTARRALGVFWSIVFGNRVFKETHLGLKLVALAIIIVALVLLANS